MLEVLSNQVLVCALMIIAFLVAIVCAIISLVKENREQEKIAAENFVATDAKNAHLFMTSAKVDQADYKTAMPIDEIQAQDTIDTAEVVQEYTETADVETTDEVTTSQAEISKSEQKQAAKEEKLAEKEAKQAEKQLAKEEKQTAKADKKEEKKAEKIEKKAVNVVEPKEKTAKNAVTQTATATNVATATATTATKAKATTDPSELEAKIYGKYTIQEVADEGFQFTLYDNKGKKLFQSVTYSTRAICVKNIGYFKKNVQIGTFSVDGETATGFRFVLKRGVVSYVGIAQKTQASAEKAIEAVKKFVLTDVII